MTEDHTDKVSADPTKEAVRRMEVDIVNGPNAALIQRADELIPQLLKSVSTKERERQAAQVISDLKTALERAEQDLADATTQDFSTLLAAKRAAEARVEEVQAAALKTREDQAFTIGALTEDLDRISAEREAYREALKQRAEESCHPSSSYAPAHCHEHDKKHECSHIWSRRILAENDR